MVEVVNNKAAMTTSRVVAMAEVVSNNSNTVVVEVEEVMTTNREVAVGATVVETSSKVVDMATSDTMAVVTSHKEETMVVGEVTEGATI